MQTLGPQNPLVSMQQYANTLTRMIELAGFQDAQSFDTEVPPMPPMPQEHSQTAALLAQAEAQTSTSSESYH